MGRRTRTFDPLVNTLLEKLLDRHARKLRSAAEVERVFACDVRPVIGAKSIYELRSTLGGQVTGLSAGEAVLV